MKEENKKEILDIEQKYLNNASNHIEEEIKRKEVELERLPRDYRDDPFLLASLMSSTATRITRLNNIKEKPYFARIDFKEKDKDNKNHYIGKTGLMDEVGNTVIIDWRAPVCTLYYDSNIGYTNYLAPLGLIEGELSLKRQIIITDKKIKEYYDVDTVSDDELLKPYLGANADNRLKNIVASIQKEQNQIIRSSFNKNFIIQGVAGSGKTTVALHRVAYLIYNENGRYKSDQFMVIGPNKFFINYISSVLPDLEVDDVKQYTIEEIALKFLNEKINIKDASHSLSQYINTGILDETLKYKTSWAYKEAIDMYLSEYEESLLSKSLVLDDFQVLSSNEIKKAYLTYKNDNNMKLRVEKTINYLTKHIINNSDLLCRRLEKSKEHLYINLNIDDPKRYAYLEAIDKQERRIKAGCNIELKKYFTNLSTPIIALYKSFISNINKYSVFKNNDLLKHKTLDNLHHRTIEFEDIAALIYIKIRRDGIGDYYKYAHIIVDEAQDFGIFNFYALRLLFERSTFTIFGDLAQAIYSYRSIDNWEDIKNRVFESNCDIMRLEKSYRTTIEIMNMANMINKHLTLDVATPVIRHGLEVEILNMKNNKIDFILNKCQSFISKEYKSIAIICKSDNEALNCYQLLKDNNLNIEHISNKNNEYKGGICVLSSYLAKGLEFDAVIIYNADESVYNSNNNIDMKLLYVAMTRALHELYVLYDNKLTKPLINAE